MDRLQRYVSDELTHFVGRGLPEEEQYALLVEVLRSGLLAPEGERVDGDLVVDLDEPLSGNRSYQPEAVCLCDIPLGDLHLHIAKYSPFGLAFAKPYLVARGASPMFYVAADAPADEDASRAQAFDEMAREHHTLRETATSLLDHDDARAAGLARRYLRYAHLLDFHVYSYTKFFSYPEEAEAAENHYMEREWRLLGALRFSREDVRRVVFPESYAPRFRKDFPDYSGQVTFSAR